MKLPVVAIALLSPTLLLGGVNLILSTPYSTPADPACHTGFARVSGAFPGQLNTASTDDHTQAARETVQQVISVYRQLGTAPEEYLKDVAKSDAKFPPGAFGYITVNNDATGKAEGILRVVSGDPQRGDYFNSWLTPKTADHHPEVPMYEHYKDPAFRKFLDTHYPNRVEFGRLVFGEGVKKNRVLTDLFSAAASLCWQSEQAGVPPRYAVVEVVPAAVELVEGFGFQRVEIPIKFDDGRTFMAVKIEDLHRRLIGNVTPITRMGERGLSTAIGAVSASHRLQSVFLLGYYQRAIARFQDGDFKKMAEDVAVLKQNDPDNREYRKLELFSEVGGRYDWHANTGDWQEAVRFLELPATREHFADKKLPEDQFPHFLGFMKGLVYLRAGKIESARAARREVEAQITLDNETERTDGLFPSGKMPRRFAAIKVEYWTEHLYDPATQKGSAESAIQEVSAAESDSRFGLTPELYRYKARLLTSLKRNPEAKQAEEIARRLE